jgi:hypothetical protein
MQFLLSAQARLSSLILVCAVLWTLESAVPFAPARAGLYYLVRSLTITPAAAVGGLLWKVEPQAPFITAGVIGVIGTIVFAATVEERDAS